MTERQAWSYLARRWDAASTRPYNRAHGVIATVRLMDSWGVCESISRLFFRPSEINGDVLSAMRTRMERNKPAGAWLGYWWPRTRTGARSRAAFCRRMAKLA